MEEKETREIRFGAAAIAASVSGATGSGRLGGAAAAGRRRHRGDDGARALVANAADELMMGAAAGKLERDITRSPEAQALQEAIVTAVSAYANYLERSGLVFNEADNAIGWRDDRPKSLVVRWEFNQGMVITLDGGSDHPGA